MKPTEGLKFLLPHLSEADHRIIDRYVAEIIGKDEKPSDMTEWQGDNLSQYIVFRNRLRAEQRKRAGVE